MEREKKKKVKNVAPEKRSPGGQGRVDQGEVGRRNNNSLEGNL